MPRLGSRIPKYRKHKATGQAVVTLGGKDLYLGPWKSKARIAEYDRLIGEWRENGRRLPTRSAARAETLTIDELVLAFMEHAETYYRKNGHPTSEIPGLKRAVRFLVHSQ